MRILWMAVCMLVPAADADLVSIRTRDGRTIVGRVDGIDEAGNYVGKTEDGSRLVIPERDVLSVDPKNPSATPAAPPERKPIADEEALRKLVRKILAEELRGMAGTPAATEEPAPSPPPEPSDTPAPPARWFPATVGSWWVYRRDGATTRSRERWEIASAAPCEEGLIKLDVVVRSLDEDPPTAARRWYYLGNDSLSAGAAPGKGGDVLLRAPLREGEDWVWSTPSRNFRRTCRSLSDTVHTPAGTFAGCLSIRAETAIKGIEGVSVAETITFAPGVGIVRIEGESPLILLEYEIAP